MEPGGPAAGIKPGDLIVSVDERRVADTDQLAIVLAQVKPRSDRRSRFVECPP